MKVPMFFGPASNAIELSGIRHASNLDPGRGCTPCHHFLSRLQSVPYQGARKKNPVLANLVESVCLAFETLADHFLLWAVQKDPILLDSVPKGGLECPQ